MAFSAFLCFCLSDCLSVSLYLSVCPPPLPHTPPSPSLFLSFFSASLPESRSCHMGLYDWHCHSLTSQHRVLSTQGLAQSQQIWNPLQEHHQSCRQLEQPWVRSKRHLPKNREAFQVEHQVLLTRHMVCIDLANSILHIAREQYRDNVE